MRLALLFVCATFVYHTAVAQDVPAGPPAADPAVQAERIAERLASQGFENLSVERVDGRLAVRFENRTFRYEVRALHEALAIIQSELPPEAPFNATLLHLGLPVLRASRPVLMEAAAPAPVTYTLLPHGWDRGTNLVPRRRPPTFTFDVAVHPQLAASLGNFDDPFETQFNLAPALTTSFWPGMELTAQLIVPIINELDAAESDLRPGLLTLTQFLRPAPSTLANVTVGYFTENRYGIDARVRRYLLGGQLAVGARVGYTGFLAFQDREVRYGDLDRLLYRLEARYYVFPAQSFWVGASYGRFLFDDVGWRVDMQRRFGEVEVALFGVSTERGRNAGIELSLPLPPFRQAPPRPFRIRPAHAFSWYYLFDKLEPAGTDYRTGSTLDAFWNGIEPGSLHYDLGRVRRGAEND